MANREPAILQCFSEAERNSPWPGLVALRQDLLTLTQDLLTRGIDVTLGARIDESHWDA